MFPRSDYEELSDYPALFDAFKYLVVILYSQL